MIIHYHLLLLSESSLILMIHVTFHYSAYFTSQFTFSENSIFLMRIINTSLSRSGNASKATFPCRKKCIKMR